MLCEFDLEFQIEIQFCCEILLVVQRRIVVEGDLYEEHMSFC